MAAPRMSFVNLLACAGVTVSATAEDALYKAANLAQPERPFFPFRSATTTGAVRVTVDFGSSQAADLVYVNRANFSSIQVQGNNANTWATPAMDSSTLTIGRNPYTGRYQLLYPTSCGAGGPFGYRYLSFVIPSQAQLAEKETTTPAAYYLVGGLWAGLSTGPPAHLRVPTEIRTIEPRADVKPGSDAWEQRLVLGEPRVHVLADWTASVALGTPAVGDTFKTMVDLDRRMRERGLFLFDMNLGDAAQAWIVRRRSDQLWTLQGIASERVELTEVVGP